MRSLGWEFNLNYHNAGVGVLWAIGWSMVILSALVYLPVIVVTIIGVVIVALHNAFDAVRPADFGPLGWLWTVLHVSRPLVPRRASSSPSAIPLFRGLVCWPRAMVSAPFFFGNRTGVASSSVTLALR